MTDDTTTPERIDLNEADESLLEKDLGLNPGLSRAIVAYRQREGRFAALAELLNVPGFTAQLLRALRPRILI